MIKISRVPITRISNGTAEDTFDPVVVEKTTTFFVDEEKVTLHHLPGMEVELAIGYAITQGLITSPRLYYTSNEKIKVYSTRHQGTASVPNPSTCNRAHLDLNPSLISKLMGQLLRKAEIHRQTGGTHIMGVADFSGNLLYSVEDISRHCALDKAVGLAAVKEIPLCNKLLLLSSRITYSLAFKIANAGFPVAATRGAVTLLAVNHLKRSGIKLVGFVRGDRMNIYVD